jgi:site-specific recombinase XerD
MPDMALKKATPPALARAGIAGKTIGWHNFRSSLTTDPLSLGGDVKFAQKTLRQANSCATMDLYTQAVPAAKETKELPEQPGAPGCQ